MLEELYPVIAVSYGTFGICFGVLLWWKTQRRIDRTKAGIEKQVAEAVVDIRGQVKDTLGSVSAAYPEQLRALGIPELGKQLDALGRNFTDLANNIPDPADFRLSDEQIEALEQRFSTHVYNILQAEKSAQSRRMGEFMEQFEPQFKDLEKNVQAELMQRGDFVSQAAWEIANMKVPAKTGPVAQFLMKQSKLQAQAYLAQLTEQMSGEATQRRASSPEGARQSGEYVRGLVSER